MIFRKKEKTEQERIANAFFWLGAFITFFALLTFTAIFVLIAMFY